MTINENTRPLVEQQVRAFTRKAITKEQLYQRALGLGWDQEAVDAMIPKEPEKKDG